MTDMCIEDNMEILRRIEIKLHQLANQIIILLHTVTVNIHVLILQELPRDPSVEESVHNELEAQERLGCKSFDWYLNHIIPELQVPPETAQYYGNVSYSILMDQTCH